MMLNHHPCFRFLTFPVFTVCLLFLFSTSLAQQTFFPPTVPLAVRSTYLSSWLATSNLSQYSNVWPTTAGTPSQVLGWAGLVKIDDTSYWWLGQLAGGGTPTNVTNMTITPTRTIFTLQAGPMDLTITFLSPIEPGDFVQQSIPFSYVAFEAKSSDGQAHRVQVYSDVSGEWASGDRGQTIQWSTNSGSNSIYHSVSVKNQTEFTEVSGQAQWGTLYYASKQGSTVSYRSGKDSDVRGQFMSQGSLDNSQDTNFRILTDDFPVYGVAQNLGTITSTSSPVVWAVGYVRDPAISYTDLSGSAQQRHLFYLSSFSDINALIDSFLGDYSAALARAIQLDSNITEAANAISSDGSYADLVSISTRQVFGATELTIAKSPDGSFNKSDVMMFMKDLGASDNRVNPVEILFASFPMFMYIDPTLGAPLLEPLLRFQSTSQYKLSFAAQDLGSSYPKATGSNTDHRQGVEQTGNMIIMAFAQARASGDGALIGKYYSLLKKWTNYLVANSVSLSQQFSSDDSSTAQQANLAIKGIIAVQAMSGICSALGQTADAQNYSTQAQNLYAQWKTMGLGTDQHILDAYGQQDSWTIGYNLFADSWLGTKLVESSIFNAQATVIQGQISTSPSTTNFGIPVDSTSGGFITSSWDMFAAAMTTNATVRNSIITRVHNRASILSASAAFPLHYEGVNGSAISGTSSPGQGAVFAPLALTIPVASINSSGFDSSAASGALGTSSESHAGAVAGGVIGALVGLGAVGGLAYFLMRRQRRARDFYIPSIDPLPADSTTQLNIAPSQEKIFTTYDTNDGEQAFQRYNQYTVSESGLVIVAPHRNTDSIRQSSSEADEQLSSRAPSQTLSSSRSASVGGLPAGPAANRSRQPLSAKERMRQRLIEEDAQASGGVRRAASSIGSSSGSARADDIDAEHLREEVAVLRREMQEIRAERLEPPPSYNG